MQAIELATLIIAGVGTITSILIYLDRKIGKRRKIKVRIRHGFVPHSREIPQKYIIVELSNPREISTTITSVSIGSGNDLMIFLSQDVYGYEKLPLELEPGKNHLLLYNYEIIKKLLSENNQNTLSALCTDALGKTYKSNNVRFNFNF